MQVMLKITEHQFGDILLNSAEIQKLVKTNKFLVAREFKVDSAVPDFVLITASDYQDIIELSQKYPPEIFRGVYSSLICMLYGSSHTRSIDTIAKANFVSPTALVRAAKKLQELNILTLDDKNLRIARTKEFYLPKIDVISLELKLDKWKKALWQASRNKAYYAKSYVVMPSEKEDLIRQNMDYFSVNGVSAVVVDTSGGAVKFVGREKRKDHSSDLTMQRLAGLSYLMQGKNSFVEFNY